MKTKRTSTHGALAWRTRWTRCETDIAHWRVLVSRCGRYRIVHETPKLAGLPVRWVAMRRAAAWRGPDAWDILGSHRTQAAALRTCEQSARRAKGGPR